MFGKLVLFSLILCFALPVAFAAEATPATPQLTAEEVIAKNVAARGGLGGWRAVHSMIMSGRMEVGKGMAVPFTLELKRPRKMRLEIVFREQTAVQVYDGTKGWKLRPFLGRKEVEPFSPDELQAASAQVELDGPLVDYAAKGFKAELVGRESLDGHDAYKLKLTKQAKPNEQEVVSHIWLDANTLLELKADAGRRIRGRERRVTTQYRDYKWVGGLLIPHVVETSVEGAPESHKIVVESVVLNPKLKDARFTTP
ncbi:MAG: hypothetical protein ACE14L_05410 [Terriglobales bacterium]